MPAPFDDLAGLVNRACGAVFGAGWTLIPMVCAPNQRPAPDTSRAPFDVDDAIFRQAGKRVGFSDQRQAMESGKGVGVAGAVRGLGLIRSTCAWVPKAGDHAVNRATSERYSITHSEPFGSDGQDLLLVRVSP